MEVINNRYRIMEQLHQNRLVSTYLAVDMRADNKVIRLSLLNAEYTPQSLIDYYTDSFIAIKNLTSKRIVRNFHFNTISHIDNKVQQDKNYFFTSAHIATEEPFVDFVQSMTIDQVLDAFVELCTAVHYLHLKGFIYGELNLNNIFVVESNRRYKLMLKDLATVELDKHIHTNEGIEDSYFKSPKVLSGNEPDVEADMYALGVILLAMLRKKAYITNPRDELRILKQENTSLDQANSRITEALIPILEDLLVLEDYPFSSIQDMTTKLGESLGLKLSIIETEEIEKLQFHTKSVGRELETDIIIRNFGNLSQYKPSKRIFLVQGEDGIGKTRFLKEMKFLLGLQKATVYASFSLSDTGSSKQMWIDILSKMIVETDIHTVEKYKEELMRYFPELVDQEQSPTVDNSLGVNSKYRILNRIGGFINESVKNKPAIILIDDIHLADDFTFDTLNYLCSEILEQNNLMFLLSGASSEDNENKAYRESVENLKRRKNSEIIRLRRLDTQQSGEMIRNILAISYIPVRLTERIYSRSFGNPLFISEVIKDLYSRNIMEVNPQNGMWSINLSARDYDLLEIPDSIEQALVNQLQDLTEQKLEILEAVAIFNKPVTIETITKFLQLPMEHIEEHLAKLARKGIIQRLVSDIGYLFEFNNKVLKQIVYDRISADERIKKHMEAAVILEEELDTPPDELIFHHERAKNWEKTKQYYLENASKMLSEGNKKGEILNLEKALSLMEDIEEKTKLLMEIGVLYSELNETENSLKSFDIAEQLAISTNHAENVVHVYLNIAGVYSSLYDIEQTKAYMQKVEQAFTNYEDKKSRLEFRRLQAFLLNVENRIEESSKILHSIVTECDDEFPRIKGNTYLLLGFVYLQHNKITEALKYYQQAINLLERAGYTKGVLGATNNIGIIYQGYLGDAETAMTYFVKARDLSEEYGIVLTEIQALSNIAGIYHNTNDLQTAVEHYKFALKKAERVGMSRTIVHLYNSLAFVSVEMNDYEQAFYYYKLIEEKMSGETDLGLDIFDYYNTSMELYQSIGHYEESDRYSQKIVEYHKGRENIYSFAAIVYQTINRLRNADVNQVENLLVTILDLIEKIPRKEFNLKALSMASIALSQKGNKAYSNEIMLKANDYLTSDTPDHLLASYYYAKGISGEGNESVESLRKSLEYAKKSKSPELVAKVNLLLGDYYDERDQLFDAANYYLEGSDVASTLIYQVPEQYRFMYVSRHNLGRGFIRLKEMNDQLTGEQISLACNNRSYSIDSIADLDEIIGADEIGYFIQNKAFLQYISDQHLALFSNKVRKTTDLLKNLSADTTKNIDMIIRYLAGITLATRGLVITENQRHEFTVLASTDDKMEMPENLFLFNRVRTTMEPVLLSGVMGDNKVDSNFLSKDLRASLYIPIINRQGSSEEKNVLLGYVYLETDKLANNFNDSGLENCKEISSFLALLLEKHQLKISASLDKLTGSLTRKYLDDSLHEAVESSRKNGERFSIIMFDLDRFKQVNDRYGHQVGDSVLRKVASVVMDNLKQQYDFGRYGGEEFIIILPAVHSDNAYEIAEGLRKTIAAQKLLGDKFDVTVSMGVSTYPNDGQTVKELVEKADQALYVAKESGRNNCQVWSQDFANKSKPANKLTGILSGDEIKDSRTVLAMVELIELMNKPMSMEEKLYYYLGRIIEITEAQVGYILLIEDSKITKSYGRKAQEENWLRNISFNQAIVNSIMNEERGLYTINWDEAERDNKVNGLPDWDSILAVPITIQGYVRGVIYLTVPARVKEFGVDELNLVSVYSNLATGVINSFANDYRLKS
ncbi:diguanylate cyclase [Ornithinibacillus xuwenensis]|uniref:Diguanylate cyclase n=1 Tax=Ornithinibacillus xuwenensis TaxID=3144668 RepID=A0ABU9XL51_9BACI